jgi:hypothetical protein
VAGERLVTWFSPFTSVPRALRRVRRTTRRQRVAGFCLFALVPSVLFWWWYLTAVQHRLPHEAGSLAYAMPAAAAWVALAPVLMQHGEFVLERLVKAFARMGGYTGWNLEAMQRELDRMDRAYYAVVLPLGLLPPLALALSYRQLGGILPIGSTLDRVAGLAVITAVGLASASGLWGAAKALLLVAVATATATPTWQAFHSDRIWGLRQLYSFAWSEGTIFSFGALFIPAMLAVQPRLSAASKVIVWCFVVLLLVGGLALFSVPTLLLARLAQRRKDAALDALAPLIADAIADAQKIDRLPLTRAMRARWRLDAMLRLRQEMVSAAAAPFSFDYIARASATLVLPALLTAAQIVAQR